MMSALRSRILASPILGCTNLGELFTNITTSNRLELIAQLQVILQQTKSDGGDFLVSDEVVRYVALQLAKLAVYPDPDQVAPGVDANGDVVSVLITNYYNSDAFRLQNQEILDTPWVNTIRQSEGLQKQFDNVLLNIVGLGKGAAVENIVDTERNFYRDGLKFYNDVALGISMSQTNAEEPKSVGIAREFVSAALLDYQSDHGYVSMVQLLTFYRINEVFRLAVLGICKLISSIGFGDSDDALLAAMPRSYVEDLTRRLSSVSTVHVMTKSIPRSMGLVMKSATRVYLYDDNTVPPEVFRNSRLKFLYWIHNMTIVNEFPSIQLEYFEALNRTMPKTFGVTKKTHDVHVQFLFFDYVGDPEDIVNFPSLKKIKRMCKSFLVNTTRGYIKVVTPGVAKILKTPQDPWHKEIHVMVDATSRRFYASANFTDLMSDQYSFLLEEVPTSGSGNPDESSDEESSSSLSSSDEDEGAAMDIGAVFAGPAGRPISVKNARMQLRLLLSHMGVDIEENLQAMSRAGLIIFIRNLLAAPEDEKGSIPYVTKSALVTLLKDLNRLEGQLPPFLELAEKQLEEANAYRTDEERLVYYSKMTIDDIERIYNRYEEILDVGQTAVTEPARESDPVSFLDRDELYHPDWDPDFDYDLGSTNEFFVDQPAGLFSVAQVTRSQEAIDAEAEAIEQDIPYGKAIENVRLDIRATVFEMIQRNASYTHQGHPDLLKLLRIIRLSPLFFDVAVEEYIPIITSLVIRGDARSLANLETEVQMIPDQEWARIQGAFKQLFRIMSLYEDPILEDAASFKRIKPLLMQIREFRMVMYKNGAVPQISALFLSDDETAKLRILVFQYRISGTIKKLWKDPPTKKGMSQRMKALASQLSVIIEQPASSQLIRSTLARATYMGDREFTDPTRGIKVTVFRLAMEETSKFLGGVFQFRLGNGQTVHLWPQEWPAEVTDVDAEMRARGRRTMTDLAVLHELLNQPPNIPRSPLDKRVAEIDAQINYATSQRDLFREIVTAENYNMYKYPETRSSDPANAQPIEFKNQNEFQTFERFYLFGPLSLRQDELTVMSPRDDAHLGEIERFALAKDTSAAEVIYACLIFHLRKSVRFIFTQLEGTFDLATLVDLVIDDGPIGWAARNIIASRLPSVSVGKELGLNPLMDVHNVKLAKIFDRHLVNVTEFVTSSQINNTLVQSLSRKANSLLIPSSGLPLVNLDEVFTPYDLRHLQIKVPLGSNAAQAVKVINDITLLFTPQPVPDLARESAFSLYTYGEGLLGLSFDVGDTEIDAAELEEHIATLPFYVLVGDTSIGSSAQFNKFDSFLKGQKTFIMRVYRGQFGSGPASIKTERPFVSDAMEGVVATSPSMQMQAHTPLNMSPPPQTFSFSLDLTDIRANLIGSDREYAPILYTWTSWGAGRRPIRIAATDDDANTLTENWALTLPTLIWYRGEGDARIHFSLYARSRESGLESINKDEAEVIDRIIPIGRTSVSLRQLLQDSMDGANRKSRLLRFEEPVLNERLENQMIQQIGIKVTEEQRNSVRDRVMRENAGGSFRVALPLSTDQLNTTAPYLVELMEKDVTRRFEKYVDESNDRAIAPPFEEALLEPLYLRAMYPLYLRYASWFIGDDRTPPIVPPSTEEAASLHLFLWQTPIGALLPARAFWQCTPQLIPYTSKFEQMKDVEMFEDSSLDYKEMYFSDLMQISLDIDDISAEMFINVANHQLNDVTGTRVHDWFLTCAAACARVGMLVANALHYTSDFRFDRNGKQYEDEYWNIDASSGFSNSADCENSAQVASTPILRSIVMDKDKWRSPLMKAVARVLDLYSIGDIGAVVTARYVGPSDPARTGELPVIDSVGDKKSETGGHCHSLLTPKPIASDQTLNGGASKAQVLDAYGVNRVPPWMYRLHSILVEGTGAIFPYPLPLKETFAEHPTEYAFHKSKKTLSATLTRRLAFDNALGFGGYRYPFYDEKPSANRRISSFYRLLCHGVFSIEAIKAPELGKLTFAKPVGNNRYAWGVNVGEFLRDGRSGPGSARMARLSSCLDMRDHFVRYANPYIECAVNQLPLASLGRQPINTWSELEASANSVAFDGKSIIKPLSCVLCPPCEEVKPVQPTDVIREYGTRELAHAAEIAKFLSPKDLQLENKIDYMKQVVSVALDTDSTLTLAKTFSPTSLRRYSIASKEVADVLVRTGVWEEVAKNVLGEERYQDTIEMRLRFADILQGTPMYFIIIASDMMRRREVLPKGRFSPDIQVITIDLQRNRVPLPEAPYTVQKVAELAFRLAEDAVEVQTELLPMLGSSMRYFESLQVEAAAITEENRYAYEESILEKWNAHLPSGTIPENPAPSEEELSEMSIKELAVLWVDVYASEQWHSKIQLMLKNFDATPMAISEMSFSEVENWQFPPEGEQQPVLYSKKDDPSVYLLEMDARSTLASAMLLNDAYEASIRLHTLKSADNASALHVLQRDYLSISAATYNDEISLTLTRGVFDQNNLTLSYYGCLGLVFESAAFYLNPAATDTYYHCDTANWGFYRVNVFIFLNGRETTFENSKPAVNAEAQMETILTVSASTDPFLLDLIAVDDMIGPVTTIYHFDNVEGDDVKQVLTLGSSSLKTLVAERPLPDPRRLSFFAYGWILKSPEYMVPFRKRINEVSGTDSTFDVFTPLPSTGDMSLRVVVDLSKK